MNTILYIRQSKDSNNAEESLAGQEQESRYHAELTNLEITQVLRDTVTGQLTIAEREAGRQLLSAIRERTTQAILMPSVDRLSRDTWGEQDLQLLIDLLKGSGILWYFTDNHLLDGELVPFEYEDDTQILAVKVKLAASAQERINIANRTMRKKRAMLSDGNLLLTGSPPFGYYVEKHIEGNKVVRTWKKEPAQALVVERIFELYTQGNTTKQVLETLHAEEHIRDGEYYNGYTETWEPIIWNVSAIYRILSHEIYKGLYVWGKYEHNKKQGSKILREPGDPERFDLEREEFRIVSAEVWERARVIAQDNKTVRTPKEYLLRNHLYCECGEKMIGNGDYYRCKSSKHKASNCGNGSLRKDAIEPAVWSSVEHLVTNPSALHTAIWESLEQGSSAQIERKALAESARKAIAAKNRELGNLGYTISKADGERTLDMLLKQSAVLEQELNLLEQELSTLTSAINDSVDLDELNERVSTLVWEAQEEFENLDYHGKRGLLAELNMKITRTEETYKLLVSVSGVS